MKKLFVFTILTLISYESSANEMVVDSGGCIVNINENQYIVVSINSQEDSYKAANDKYESVLSDIENIAKKSGLKDLKLQNSSFSIMPNNTPNFYSKAPKYNMSASFNYKSGERDGWLKAYDSLDRIYMVAKYKEGIIIDTCWFYNDTSWITPNTIIDRMMIYKNFTSITKEDSITLGIHSVFGYMSIMAKQPGIKIKAIEYDKKGTQLNVINYKNNLPI